MERERLARRAAQLAGIVGCLLLVVGALGGDLALSVRWRPTEALDVFLALIGPALLLAAAAFTRLWSYAVLAVLTLAGVVTFGAPACLALLLGGLGAFALGRAALARDAERPLESAALAGALGLGAIATVMSWTAPAPIHFDFTYALLALGVIVWRRADAIQLGRDIADVVARSRARPLGFAVALDRFGQAAAILTAVLLSLYAAMPETGYDSLLVHFAMIESLRLNASWTYDYELQPFTLLPKLAIWSIGYFNMLGGEYAARAFNLLAVCASMALVGMRLSSRLPGGLVGLMIATFLSTPLTLWSVGWMFEEGVTTLFLTAACIALWRAIEGERPAREGVLGLVLLGFAVASKAQALFAGVVGVALVLTMLRRRGLAQGLASSALGACLFALAALFPYAHAYLETGNPFFPFDPAQTVDARWVGKLSPTIWFDFVFRSSSFMETWNGSFGLQNLPLLFIAAVFAALSRDWKARAVFIALACMSIGIMAQTQYARYQFYVLPGLLLVAGMAMPNKSRAALAAASTLVTLIVTANLVLLRTVHAPEFNLGVLADPFEYANVPPERRIYAGLNALYGPDAHVFVAGSRPFSGGLEGRAEAISTFANEIHAETDPAAVVARLSEAGVTHITAVEGFRSVLMERLCLRVCRPVPTGVGASAALFTFDASGFDPTHPGLSLLRFDAGRNQERLGEGWASPDQGGVWSNAERVSVRLPTQVEGEQVKLWIIDFNVAARPGAEQTLIFRVNGVTTSVRAYAPISEFLRNERVMLPAPAGAGDGADALIEIDIAAPIAPNEIGLSPDGRRLGVFLAQVVSDTQ